MGNFVDVISCTEKNEKKSKVKNINYDSSLKRSKFKKKSFPIEKIQKKKKIKNKNYKSNIKKKKIKKKSFTNKKIKKKKNIYSKDNLKENKKKSIKKKYKEKGKEKKYREVRKENFLLNFHEYKEKEEKRENWKLFLNGKLIYGFSVKKNKFVDLVDFKNKKLKNYFIANKQPIISNIKHNKTNKNFLITL